MHRTLFFSIDDLAADTMNVQATINKACSHRSLKYQVRGLAQIEDHVYFFLLPRKASEAEQEYVLAPVEDKPAHEEVVGMLSDRWAAGFDLVGAINVYETRFLVFAHSPGRPRTK